MKKVLLLLWICFCGTGMGFAQTKQDSLNLAFFPSVQKTMFLVEESGTKPLSKFLEFVEVDLTSFRPNQVQLTGKSPFWKSFTGYYNESYQQYLRQEPYIQVLHPNFNYPSGYPDAIFTQYICPTPFD